MPSTDSRCLEMVAGTTVKIVQSKKIKSIVRLTHGPAYRANLRLKSFGKIKIQKSVGNIDAITTTRIVSIFSSREGKSEPMRQCSECLKTRDFIAFYKNPYKSGGYELKCKICYNKQVRKTAKTLKRSEKACSNCKIVKPITDFHKATAARDGHGAYCKPCVLERAKAYRQSNPKVKLRESLAGKIYRANEDPEKRRKRKREYYAKNRDRILRQRKEKEIREAMQKVSQNA